MFTAPRQAQDVQVIADAGTRSSHGKMAYIKPAPRVHETSLPAQDMAAQKQKQPRAPAHLQDW